VDVAVIAARIGNKILSGIAVLMIMLLFSFGGHSLWDGLMVREGTFLSRDLLKYKPESGDEASLSQEELMAINPDTRGWITIDDTRIDYPVLHGETDMTYINTDIYGEFSLAGSIFLSCLNQTDFSDQYNLVYGHHVDNGGMFGDVVEFVHTDYFNTHQTGTLFLKNQIYDIELFACIEADAYDRLIYSPGSECDIAELLAYLVADSTQYREIGVTTEDNIVGLSTCADAQSNDRVILFGRLNKK